MALMLHLSPDLEQRLQQEANRQAIPLDVFALKLIAESLPQLDQRVAVTTLLQSWIEEGDPDEQRETGAYLIQTLDEDRIAERPLFPPSLKGVTW